MIDRPSRWLESELPAELKSVLASAAEDQVETARLKRLEANLRAAIGPSWLGGRAASGGRDTNTAPVEQEAGSTKHTTSVLKTPLGTTKAATVAGALGLGAVIALGLGTVLLHGKPRATPALPAEHVWVASRPAVPVTQRVEPAVGPGLIPPSTDARATTRATNAERRSRVGLAEEIEELAAMRRLLPRAPASALAAAARHARRFPRGALAPERELVQLEALLRSGRHARAKALAQRMLTASTPHPYRVQVLSLMAADGPSLADTPVLAP